MLTKEDERFLAYWEANRVQQRHSMRPFLVGLSAGFVFGIGVVLVVYTGWYERAEMVANARMNAAIFLLGILVVSCFMAFVYRKFRWENYEQRYKELLAKKRTIENKSS